MSRDRALKLKFEISSEDHDRLRAAFVMPDAQKVQRSRQLKVYLDTPDKTLRQQDMVWCFSRKDKIRDSRLKAGDWRLESDGDARSFIKKHRLRDQIGGVFSVRFDQEEVAHLAAHSEIIIGLERSVLQNGDQSTTICEVQFAAQHGNAEALERFVGEYLPNAKPSSGPLALIEHGYRLSEEAALSRDRRQADSRALEQGKAVLGKTIQGKPFNKDAPFDKNMSVAEAFSFIARAELLKASAEPVPIDAASVQQNIDAVRRVRSAFRFFAEVLEGAGPKLDVQHLAEWETALEKLQSLDRAISVYLKPAAEHGRWDGVFNLVARIEDGPRRAYVVLAQTWPPKRVKNLFSQALETIDTYFADAAYGAAAESLTAFLLREMPKAIEDIEALGAPLERSGLRHANNTDIHILARAVARLSAVVAFFEPLTSGKSARRLATLLEVLDDLTLAIEKEYQLRHAQELIAETVAHIARMKQTKTQIAQIFAAGALTGYLEAQKKGQTEKAFKKAFAALSEVKPFWTKIE